MSDDFRASLELQHEVEQWYYREARLLVLVVPRLGNTQKRWGQQAAPASLAHPARLAQPAYLRRPLGNPWGIQ